MSGPPDKHAPFPWHRDQRGEWHYIVDANDDLVAQTKDPKSAEMIVWLANIEMLIADDPSAAVRDAAKSALEDDK